MPAWWQAPTLTEKARGKNSNPQPSAPHQAQHSPFPKLGSTSQGCGWPIWLTLPVPSPKVSSSTLTTGKGLDPHHPKGGFFQIKTPLSLCLWFSYSIYNLCRWLFGKQRKRWMGFPVVWFLMYILAIPRSLMWENMATLSGGHACGLCSASCLGDRLNHIYWAKKIAHQRLLYLYWKGLFKSYRTWGVFPPFSLLCLQFDI